MKKGDQPKQLSEADAELQREILAGRKFSLAEAIGRLAGPGMMKGTSPVSQLQQAVAVIEDYLKRHMPNVAGVLFDVVLRQVKASEPLLRGFDQPLLALARCVRHALGSDNILKELVREADVEWGRVFGERPYFEKEGSPPSPDDPCTLESMRAALTQLADQLAAGAT